MGRNLRMEKVRRPANLIFDFSFRGNRAETLQQFIAMVLLFGSPL